MPAAGVGLLGEVEVPARSVGIDVVGKRSVGSELQVVLIEGESGFEQLASGEIVLVFGAGDVGRFHILGIRQLRALRREEGVLVVQVVHEKTGGEDVAGGEVGLNFGEVAEAEGVVVVLAGGEFGVDGVVIFAVEGVVEPHLSPLDGTGEGEARKELVETPSALVLYRRNKVGGREAEVIVADAGVEAEQAGGTFAIFGGLTRGLDLNGAESVGTDADQEQSVGGLGDVEAIDQGHGLVGLSAGDVRLAGLVLHNAGNEIERIAIVVVGGKDDVDDIEAADGFLRGDLSGIDCRRRFVDVDDFADFLLVRDGDFDGGTWRELDAGLDERVEALFFDVELVLACGKCGERAASGEVGLAADGGLCRRLQGDAGGGDSDSVFVGDGDDRGRRGLGRGRGEKSEREEESTHAGQGYFTVGCVGESGCWN
ncbi:hypothetical protein SBA2_40052 [Acidobacteriia bacterium SbA2]|nr:hypothetical protein SBA2_40052 [Acidobacteriia bacterium SbA2]